MSDILGTLDHTTPEVVSERHDCAIEAALKAGSGIAAEPLARDILPGVDFDDPGETEWSGTADAFIQTPDSNLTPEEKVTAYEIDSDSGNADDRAIAIYGFEAVAGAQLVGSVEFISSDDQTFERALIQGLTSGGERPIDRQRILRSPLLFGVQDNAAINFVFPEGYSTVDDPPVSIKLLGATVEKPGRVIGQRS